MIRTRHTSFAAVLLFFSTALYAQEHDELTTTDVTRINFLAPGVGYEKSIGDYKTLYGSAFLSTSFYYTYSSSFGSDAVIFFRPGLEFQYRYYYNFNRRFKRGKRTAMNSANYIAPAVWTVFSEARISDDDINEGTQRPITTFGVVWGLQRNGRKRFSLDLNLGFGYVFAKGTRLDANGNRFTKYYHDFGPITNIHLGFWLNKRK